MRRHFTATAFVVHDGATLLHWHRKLGQWMPPGGHLLPGEDPIDGVLREIEEETGLRAEIVPTGPTFAFDAPRQLPAPYTILIERIDEPGDVHEHIDLIYVARSLDGAALRPPAPDDVLVWVSEDQLARGEPLARGETPVAVAEDVRVLALEAVRIEREAR